MKALTISVSKKTGASPNTGFPFHVSPTHPSLGAVDALNNLVQFIGLLQALSNASMIFSGMKQPFRYGSN